MYTEEEMGKIIRILRGDMSLRNFADKCDISHTTIDNIEKGIDFRTKKTTQVKIATLQKIANKCNVPISFIIGTDNNRLYTARSAYKEDLQTVANHLEISIIEYIALETTEYQIADDYLNKLSIHYRLDIEFLMGKEYKVTFPVSKWRKDQQDDYYNADPALKECLLCKYGNLQYVDSPLKTPVISEEHMARTEQEKTLLTVFRETTEEGRMEMIAAIINIKKAIEAKRTASSDSALA